MSAAEPDNERTEAEALFFVFLARMQAGEDVSFDAFCSDHPQQEQELRKLMARWKEIEPLVNSLMGGDDPSRVLARLLATQGEPSIPPTLSMHVAADAPPGGQPGDLVEHLAAPAGPAERYDIRGEFKSGGMGTIHRIWDKRLRRQLAMKTILVKDGAASADSGGNGQQASSADQATLARFLEEAYITGQLDHPGIVPVHDLGVDEQGRLFFTMKLVKGRTLASILERIGEGEEWTLNRALGVLLRVCEAVAYAHSKGVLHRDIKPANIMVGRYGESYIMDWGLARMLRQDPAQGASPPEGEVVTLPVEEGAAAGEAHGTDSWLFTQDHRVQGTPVYMSPEQAGGDVQQVDERSDIYSLGAVLYHIITGHMPFVEDGEVPIPFVVLMKVRRGPPAPVLELAPDAPPTLVSICERAMSRELEDRHASVAQMAAELEDYLEDVSEAREEARQQARRAQNVNAFLMDMLASGDPAQAQGRDVTVREVLDRASQQIEVEPPGQATDEAALRSTIGNLYRALGRPGQAEPHLLRAAELNQEALGIDHADTLAGRAELALLHRVQGRHEEAEEGLRDAMAAQQRVLGQDHADTLRTRFLLAGVLFQADARLEEAEELYRQVLEGRQRVLGEDHPDTLLSMDSLAMAMKERGRLEQAVGLLRRTVDGMLRVLGEHHPDTLVALNDLALVLDATGERAEAGVLFRRALEGQRRVLGESHPETLTSMNNLAQFLKRGGELELAETLTHEALQVQRALVGPDHPNTLGYMNNLALLIQERGRIQEAEILLRECVRRAEATLSTDHDHRYTERFRYNLGRCLARAGRLDEARTVLRRARDTLRRVLGASHDWTREAQHELDALDTPGG